MLAGGRARYRPEGARLRRVCPWERAVGRACRVCRDCPRSPIHASTVHFPGSIGTARTVRPGEGVGCASTASRCRRLTADGTVPFPDPPAAAGGLRRQHPARARVHPRQGALDRRAGRLRLVAALGLRASSMSATTTQAISQHLFTWIPAGDFNVEVNLFVDQLTAIMLLVVTTRRLPGPRLLDRLHARRRRLLPLLLLPAALRLLDADAGPGRQLPAPVRLLGGGRSLLLPADRLLVQAALGHQRGQEGVHRQPDRRPRLRPRRSCGPSPPSARSTSTARTASSPSVGEARDRHR